MKKAMKSFLILTVLCTIFTQVVIPPKKANAIILLAASNGEYLTPLGVVVCIALWPVCLLDQKTDGVDSATVADLKANMYSDSDIAQIQKDQAGLVQALASTSRKIEIGPKETAQTLTNDIRTVYPAASDTFVNYAVQAAGLN